MAKNKNVASNYGEFETTHAAGFNPAWKPKNAGEFIVFRPTFKIKKLPKQKGIKQQGFNIDVVYLGGNSDNFYRGGGKNTTQVEVKNGEEVSLMLSYNLQGEDAIGVLEKGEMRLSKLAEIVIEKGSMMKLIFEGNVKIGGGRSVNQYTVQSSKGMKELIGRKVTVKKK